MRAANDNIGVNVYRDYCEVICEGAINRFVAVLDAKCYIDVYYEQQAHFLGLENPHEV